MSTPAQLRAVHGPRIAPAVRDAVQPALLRVQGEHGVPRPGRVAPPVARVAVPHMSGRDWRGQLVCCPAAVGARAVAKDLQVVIHVAEQLRGGRGEHVGRGRGHHVMGHPSGVQPALAGGVIQLGGRVWRGTGAGAALAREALPQAVPRGLAALAPPARLERPSHHVVPPIVQHVPPEPRVSQGHVVLARQLGRAQLRLVLQGQVVIVDHGQLVQHLADGARRRRRDPERLGVPLDLPVRSGHPGLQRLKEATLAVSDSAARRAPLAQPQPA
eukprot:scaffold19163_cov103-Isochrysis_galbana.AAC.3